MVVPPRREDSPPDRALRADQKGRPLKLAIVHEWLVTRAGSDRVLETFCEMWPEADVFATIFWPQGFAGSVLTRRRIRTSPIQRLPRNRELYRNYLPLMPFAVRSHNLEPYDVVLSSSHAVAKGVRLRPDQLHLCYCYTPPRYLWDMQEQYLASSRLGRGPLGWGTRGVIGLLRAWDRRTARQVHHFAAISNFTAERIRRIYGRAADVIFPPCEIPSDGAHGAKGDYFVTVSRLVSYKRVDLIVRAFNRLGRKLVVLGDGPGLSDLRAIAGPNVRFAGWVSDEERVRLVAGARGFVFAAEEDFGIAPVEAQAVGTPVIAFGRGGIRDTVTSYDDDPERATGLFFPEQSEDSIVEAIGRFEKIESKFALSVLRRNAERFSKERFFSEFRAYLNGKFDTFYRA